MKHSDEMVDRVLAGLREVEAPVGLERRLLAAMQERAVTRVGWRPMRWVVACAVVAVGVAGVVMMRPVRVPVQKRAAVGPSVRVERVQKRSTEIRTVTAIPDGPPNLSDGAALHVAQNDLRGQNDLRRRVMRAAVEDSAEVGGFPAPPMPLTESEKLLLRVAHRADATALTPLNAEARARQGAEFDAEFMEFFKPAAVLEDESNSTEKDKGDTQ